MKSKNIEIGGTKFIFSSAGGMVCVSIISPNGTTVAASMTEQQSATLGDVFKVMSNEMREHSI